MTVTQIGKIPSQALREVYGRGAEKAVREAADAGIVGAYDPQTNRKLNRVGKYRPVLYDRRVVELLEQSTGYLETSAALRGLTSVKQYAKDNGCSTSQVYRMIASGHLEAYNYKGESRANPGENSDTRRVFVKLPALEPPKRSFGQWLTGALRWRGQPR